MNNDEKRDDETVVRVAPATTQGDEPPAEKDKGKNEKKRRSPTTVLVLAIFGLCLGLSLAASVASLAQGWLLARQVAALQTQIAAVTGEGGNVLPARPQEREPSPPVTGQQPLAVQVTDVATGDEHLDVTLLVYRHGPADLLFETPVLVDANDHEYRPTTDSLEQAHYDLLNLVTGGQAETSLQFPRPASTTNLRLIFNAGRTAGDPVAPRIVVPLDGE